MKKGILLIALMALLTFNSNAQFEIGPKFGFNFSSLNGDLGFYRGNTSNKFEMSGMQRIAFGIGTSHNLSDNIYFSPELLLSYKGANFETPLPKIIFNYWLTYMEMPLLLNIGVFSNTLSYYGIIGPYLAYMVGGEGEYILNNLQVEKQAIADFYTTCDNQEYNSFDVGLQLGGGVSYELGPGSVVGELRYGFGFIKASETSPNTLYQSTGKNNVFTIMFGYRFLIEGGD